MARIYGLRLNFRGVQEVMRDPRVSDHLLQRMRPVAAQSGGEAYIDPRPSEQLPVARVSGDLRREAETGYLSASLDAAGGRPN